MHSSLFLAQQTLAYNSGYRAGQVVFLLTCAAGLWKSVEIARRPAANAKCALSLAVLLAGLLVAATAGFILQAWPALAPIMVLAGMLALAADLAAVVLAIIGLVEYSDQKGRYSQGKTQAIVAVSLVVLQLGLIGGAAVLGFEKARARVASSLPQPRAGEMIGFPEKNFQFRTPGSPWVQVNAKALNPDNSLAFTRAVPTVYFAIIAENIGADLGMTTARLVEASKAHLESAAASLQVTRQGPLAFNGLTGWEYEARGAIRGYDFVYVNWVVATNGYAYQLISWGRSADAEKVRPAAEAMFHNFEMIDPRRLAPGDRTNQDFQSEKFAYRVKLSGSTWRRSDRLLTDVNAAEFAATHGADLALVVVPVSLLGHAPPAEALSRGLLATLGIPYPNPKLSPHRTLAKGLVSDGSDLTGTEYDLSRTQDGNDFFYRIQLLRGARSAYLVAAWQSGKGGADRASLDEALARVEFQGAPPAVPEASDFTSRQKEGHGVVLNEIGLHFFKAQRYAESIEYFKAAFELEHSRVVYLVNLLTAYNSLGRRREGLEYLDANLASVPDDSRVRAWQAFLEGQTGQTERALTNYASLFATGFEDDDHFARYLELLSATKDPDTALEAARKYLARNESVRIRVWQASLYKQKKDYTNAVAILKTQHEKAAFDNEVSYALGDAYCLAGLYQEALALAQGLVRDSDSGTAHYLEGRSQYGLKRYREAKQAFEAAQKQLPASNEVKLFLEHVSGMLGEGNNTLIKEPIPPVALPQEFLAPGSAAAPTNYAKGFDAEYLRRFTAISFEPGKEQVATDYLSIKVFDSSGVARFTTMQAPFDPLSESIFVNSLTVRDGAGQTVATGSAADDYVVDAPAEGTVSQRKVLNIPVPGLQPGYVLDLVVTRKHLTPSDRFQFVEHSFSAGLPVLATGLFVRGAVKSLKYSGASAGAPQTLGDGLGWLHEYPPIYRWEPLQKQPVDFLPMVWLADASGSWAAEVKGYLEAIHGRMRLPPGLADQARQMAASSTNPGERMAAVAAYVQTNYTYKGIEFGRRARVPQELADVFRNKYGDCKDHALLLQQMLEAAGVPARLALVNTRGLVQPDLPSLDQFDHMIVFAPSNPAPVFLDCTDKGSDLAQPVPLGLAGRNALILDETAPRFVPIPDYPRGSSTISSRREVRIVRGVDAGVKETLTVTGYYAAMLRKYFRGGDATARRTLVNAQMNNRRAELEDLNIANLDQTRQPLILELTYTLKRQFQNLGNQLLGQVPSPWERRYLGVEAVDHRATPFEITYPLTFHSSVEIDVAGYAAPDARLFAQTVQEPFVTARGTAESLPHGLKIQYEVDLPGGTFAPGQYGAFRDAMDKALRPMEQDLTFTRTAAQTPGRSR